MKIKWKDLMCFSLMLIGAFFMASCNNNISNSNDNSSIEESSSSDLSSSEIFDDQKEYTYVLDNIELIKKFAYKAKNMCVTKDMCKNMISLELEKKRLKFFRGISSE